MRRFLRLCVALAVLAGIAWWLLNQRTLPPGAIRAKGGRHFDWVPPEGLTHFRQRDPRWSETSIGGSGETIGRVGCTLCCVAMALRYFGLATDPVILNQKLIELEGYTAEGWIRWAAVEKASQDQVRVEVHGFPGHDTIDTDIKAGRFTLAKFFLPSGVPHWVLICGKRGDDYLVLDPLLDSPQPVLLSSRARYIVSLRTLSLR